MVPSLEEVPVTRRCWLMKSEPSTFSFDDLRKSKTTVWDGVRNYQARNFMRDEMKKGDRVLFYHSNCDPPGVAGIAEVVKEGYPDHTAFDPKDKHYDEKSDPESPTWFMVDIQYVKPLKVFVGLPDLKASRKLKNMKVVQKGQRLSVQPVEKAAFDEVCRMGGVE